MLEKETGLIKIGMSKSRTTTRCSRVAQVRLARARQFGRKCTIELLVCADWPDDAERQLHRYLWREWHSHEWFRDSPRMRQCIQWMRSTFDYNTFKREFAAQKDSLPKAAPRHANPEVFGLWAHRREAGHE